MANTDFAYRLCRARSAPLQIVRYLDDDRTAADVYNPQSGNTYSVTTTSCTCSDFSKHHTPQASFLGFLKKRPADGVTYLCKHMMFLMLETGRYLPLCREVCGDQYNGREYSFIPDYKNYYGGGPTGPGFTNLYRYTVTGRIYGTSTKTGKQTDRKKTGSVCASSVEDAGRAAGEIGVIPPYASIDLCCPGPSVEQLNYITGAQIPYPALINAEDIRALLTRYQEQDDTITPSCLFELATDLRVQVSYFAPPSMVSAYIWNCTHESLHPALFCYAVYCRELSVTLGGGNISHTNRAFADFTPTRQQLKYLSQLHTMHNISKTSSAYRAATEHLHTNGIL